ncbi:MAG TPA: hypothetical protein VJY35_04775 [Candidatus Eisenbacteria bacterium]|nr:hypothetical protein [Candidatus Eisenbacteria bacterium]
MAEPLRAPENRWLRLLPLLYGALVFLPMLRNQFWLDDYGWVERAMDGVRHPSHLFHLSKSDFRPLANLSFALNYLVSGLNPAGYYLFNLALHLANTALVMRLAGRLSRGDRMVTLVTGFLFAGAFGNYGQSVVWIAGRTGLIADLLILCAMLAHWTWLERGAGRDRARALGFFLLALLAKESAVILLPLLVLLDWAHGRSPRALFSARGARDYAPFAIVLAAYLGLQFGWVRRDSVILEDEYRWGWHAVTHFGEYLARMLLPINPTTMMVRVPGGFDRLLMVTEQALMVLMPLAGLALLASPAPRWVKFAVLLAGISLLPYLAFTFRTSTRYLYGPSIGLSLVVAWLLARARAQERVRAARPIITLALGSLLVLQAIVMEVVIHQHYRMQQAQDPALYQELVRLRRTPS